jgi:hypothetical protein
VQIVEIKNGVDPAEPMASPISEGVNLARLRRTAAFSSTSGIFVPLAYAALATDVDQRSALS